MRAAYPPAWTPVDVTSDFDLDRWEQSDIWNLTVVFGLGSVERNIITFLYLSVSDRAQLRVTCFAFAVEINMANSLRDDAVSPDDFLGTDWFALSQLTGVWTPQQILVFRMIWTHLLKVGLCSCG